MSQRGQAMHLLGVAGQQQLLDHVQHKERGHAVIGKALGKLGRGENRKADRMSADFSTWYFGHAAAPSATDASLSAHSGKPVRRPDQPVEVPRLVEQMSRVRDD